jgi:hypothetical protein
MWDLINIFIPKVAETLINLAELALIAIVAFGVVKFVLWIPKKLKESEVKTK